MNVIQILCDTFRRDHLGCYGNPWIRTPNLDHFAAESVVFEKAHTGSLPTLPQRNDLFTGRYAFRKYSWQALPAEEIPIAAVLSASGVKTQMIHDTPHLVADGHDYARGFMGTEWIRGQEDESWRTFPMRVEHPEPLAKYQDVTQYLRNVHLRQSEADYFPAQPSRAVGEWLEENVDDGPFFLHVDFFDPHEPWDPPEEYAHSYDHDPNSAFITQPLRGLADIFTPGEIKNARALYAGEVSLVDKYIGRLLETIDALGLRDSTAVIFTADHGFYIGEHGIMGKFVTPRPPRRITVEQSHFYEEVAAIPYIIRLPGARPRRSSALVQPVDLAATVLELTGVLETEAKGGTRPRLMPQASKLTSLGQKGAKETGWKPQRLHGRSLVPLLNEKTDAHRKIAVTSYSLKFPTPLRARSGITDGVWTLHYCGRYGDGKQKSLFHDVFRKRKSGFRGETTPVLIHLPSDPTQDRNLLEKGVELPAGVKVDPWKKARELHAEYVKLLEAIETPKEFLKPRKWWPKK